MQSVLITGGRGFIGTHVARALRERCRVILFDNMCRESPMGIDGDELEDVVIARGDVLDRGALASVVSEVDTVLHLAAIAGVSNYYEAPRRTLDVNILGTVNVLETALEHDLRKFVFMSTSEVFGTPAVLVNEDSPAMLDPLTDRRWVYAISKLAGEKFVESYCSQRDVEFTILRPFNIYGPGQIGEGAISNFCRAAVRGEPLVIHGDGTAIRAWCFISDLVDGVIRAMQDDRAGGEVFNLGNPHATVTVRALAERVAELVPGTTFEFRSGPKAEIAARVPDISKAVEKLEFSPEVGLDDGLHATLRWFLELEETP